MRDSYTSQDAGQEHTQFCTRNGVRGAHWNGHHGARDTGKQELFSGVHEAESWGDGAAGSTEVSETCRGHWVASCRNCSRRTRSMTAETPSQTRRQRVGNLGKLAAPHTTVPPHLHLLITETPDFLQQVLPDAGAGDHPITSHVILRDSRTHPVSSQKASVTRIPKPEEELSGSPQDQLRCSHRSDVGR